MAAIQGDILDVYHDLVHRDAGRAAQAQFELHGTDQDLVDAEIGLMEFALLVVDAIQDEFKVGYFRQWRVEIGEEADVEQVAAIGIGLLVDRLDFFQQAVLLHFLMVEEVPKQVLIIQLQEGSEAHSSRVVGLLPRVVEEEPLVQ